MEGSITFRDPGEDPQPGDTLRMGGQTRHVLSARGDMLQCQDGAMRYRINSSAGRSCARKQVQWLRFR